MFRSIDGCGDDVLGTKKEALIMPARRQLLRCEQETNRFGTLGETRGGQVRVVERGFTVTVSRRCWAGSRRQGKVMATLELRRRLITGKAVADSLLLAHAGHDRRWLAYRCTLGQ